MTDAYGAPTRVSPRYNQKAFLRQFDRLGYTRHMEWMSAHKLGDQPFDVIFDELMNDTEYAKSLGPLQTGTSGAFSTIFGATAYQQFLKSPNAFNLLSKRPIEHSGFRAETAQSDTGLPGIEEGTDIGSPHIADYAEVDVKTYDNYHPTAVTQLMVNLQDKDDVLSLAGQLEAERLTFFNKVNRAVLYSNRNSPISGNMNSLHHLTSSKDHADNTAVTEADVKFYNIDRDGSNSWADAYVGHNSDSDRDLTRGLVDTAIQNVAKKRLPETSPYGNGIILTGYDTDMALTQLIEPIHRLESQYVTVNMNGVQSAPGGEGAIHVNAYKGQPIFIDDLMPDSGSGISDMMFIDTSVTSMGILQGVMFHASTDPHVNRQFSNRYLWHMQGNVWVTQPSANGLLTDLE